MNIITEKGISEAILKSKYSTRKQFLTLNKSADLINVKEYHFPINWSGINTDHSFHDNPKTIIPYLVRNIFNFDDKTDNTYIATFHTHIIPTNKNINSFPFVKTGLKRYGEDFYMLPSLSDIVSMVISNSHNKKLGQIYLGKALNVTELGMGIGVVDNNKRINNFGFFDSNALGEDDIATKKVMKLVDKKLDAEKKGKEFILYEDEMLPVLDEIIKYTLKNKLPVWFDQNSDLTFTDENLLSVGGPETFLDIFQSNIDSFKRLQFICEFGFIAIATQKSAKIDTIVKPLKPRISIPGALEELRGFTKPGIPYIKLLSDEKNGELYFHINSGREIEIEKGIFKVGKAIIPVSSTFLLDGEWGEYLPLELLEELS